MREMHRYHPLTILHDMWKTAKGSFFIVFYLFILNYNSDSTFISYAKVIFITGLVIAFISILLKWYTYKYSVNDRSFELHHGILKKTKKTIPFSKIQNVNRHTSMFHRIFRVTSIHFETGTTENSTVKFAVLQKTTADQLEAHMAGKTVMHEMYSSSEEGELAEKTNESQSKVIHFKPQRKDIVKASFTSLSFLVLIPVLGSLYSKINQMVDFDEKAEGYLSYLLGAWWITTIVILILILFSLFVGMIWTFLKYGKYEISSDDERIYIKKGILETTEFSILKNRVQAVEITQSFMKRVLGLAEVKLTSAGSLSGGEEMEINTLYPFLPLNRAHEMITELLPSYQVASTLLPLPKKALSIRLLKPSWIWLLVTGGLYYFRPVIFQIESSWLILSVLLLVSIVSSRILDYLHTGYLVHDQFIQFRTGGFHTTLFLSRRDKIIEVGVTRNIVQKFLGLATVRTVNRAQPVYYNTVSDVPFDFSKLFYTWYMARGKEVEIEQDYSLKGCRK